MLLHHLYFKFETLLKKGDKKRSICVRFEEVMNAESRQTRSEDK